MPRPYGFPRETVSPEVSECRRIPSSRRPDSRATRPWPPSWAMVTAFRVTCQAPLDSTAASASSAVTPISQRDGSGWVPVSRFHISVKLATFIRGSFLGFLCGLRRCWAGVVADLCGRVLRGWICAVGLVRCGEPPGRTGREPCADPRTQPRVGPRAEPPYPEGLSGGLFGSGPRSWQCGSYVRSICGEPETRGPGGPVRGPEVGSHRGHRPRLERRSDEGRVRGAGPPGAGLRFPGTGTATAGAALGTGALLGEVPRGRGPADQHAGRDRAREAVLPPGAGRPPLPDTRRRLLRVADLRRRAAA